jgi:Cu(I)/Ag(I) efflux system membrane protein CusA/SilA
MSEPLTPAKHPETFIERIIDASARNPFLVVVFVILGIACGIYALYQTPLDAIPDLSDVQVIVYADWEGRSPDLVEDQITYPISTKFIAAPKVKFVRGESMFGKSFVYVIFQDGTDIYWARSRVIEYLNSVRGSLPEGVNPVIGPDATGVGWVYEYALVDKSGKHDLAALRSLQDWNIRYALESVADCTRTHLHSVQPAGKRIHASFKRGNASLYADCHSRDVDYRSHQSFANPGSHSAEIS